jgi:integrase
VADLIFKLDKPNNPKTVIMMVFRYSNRKFVASTGISIDPRIWNPDKEQARTTGTVIDQQDALIINKKLAKCKIAFLTAYDHFVSANVIPTVTQLRDKYNEIANGVTTNTAVPTKLFAYINNLIDEAESKVQYKMYSKVRNLLKKYPRGAQLEFQDLNLKTLKSISDYWSKLVNEQNGLKYTKSYLNKNCSTLATILNKARIQGLPVPLDYKETDWRTSKPSSDFMGNDCTLNDNEIHIMENAELNSRFDQIRDLFLIGYYTGQRYSDFITLNKERLVIDRGKEYLQVVQQKTNKKVLIPFTSKLKSIFEKYDGYPPKITSQKFNKALQELGEHLGFNTMIIKYRVEGNANRPLEERVPKYKLMSSHTCRRSFCTNRILSGMPANLVMKISGHSNLKTLSEYVRLNLENPVGNEVLHDYF